MRELFHEIGSSIRQNKLRTALTGFAVSWGIFLLIALLGAGNGLMNSFMGNMQQYVSQTVTVSGWRTSKPYAGYKENRRIQLDQRDLAYTEGPEWEGVIGNVSVATSSQSVNLSLEGRSVNGWVRGVMPDFQETEKMQMSAGRFLNRDDIKDRRKVMVVSRSQAKELSPEDPDALIGRWVSAGSVAFRVVGIYQTDEQDFRQSCPIPYSTYKVIYDQTDKIEDLSFTVDGPRTLKEHQAFEESYTGALKRMHDIAPDDRRGIWVRNGYTENLQMSNASRILRIALWILGLLTLVSGIVGVSNIMLITVKERTHEFGIRKAIGAKPHNILSLIIAESVTITAIFGYVGMFLGMVACEVLDKTVGQRGVNIGFEEIHMLVNPSVGLDVALEATLLLIVAGTLAGIIPAWKAAKVKPIEALRAE
jgi:putative ABC transport system permease protein